MSAFFILVMGCATTGFHEPTPDQARNAEEPLEVKVETGFADVNGTRLYYELAGSGDPIVLIHGGLGDRRHFDGQFEAFAQRYKVLRYDLRRHGKSSPPVEGRAYRHVDDLKALLQHVGIPRAHITGFSLGSAVALDFALTYPEMSNSLISIGPAIRGYTSPATKEIDEMFEGVPSTLKESGPRAAAEHWYDSFRNPPIGSTIRNKLIEITSDHSFWNIFHKDPQRFVDPPAIQRLDRVNLPTLIVTAEYDIEACREGADLMEQKIPNAKKVDFPDLTHFMLMERPKEFNAVVLDFLSEIR